MSLLSFYGHSQSRGSLGLGYKIGLSRNADYLNAADTAALINLSIPSYSVFLYSNIPFRKDSTQHLFNGLKVGLGGHVRGGVFDVNGTATRVVMSFVDLDLLLPVSIPVSKDLNMQIAFGGTLGFKIKESNNNLKSDVFQPAVIFEMGMTSTHGSILGFSLSQSFTNYPSLNLSLVFGVTLGDMRYAAAKLKRR